MSKQIQNVYWADVTACIGSISGLVMEYSHFTQQLTLSKACGDCDLVSLAEQLYAKSVGVSQTTMSRVNS